MIYDFPLKIDGKEQIFQFELTRDSLVKAEARGVNVFAMTNAPVTSITGFIYAGLQKHHKISWENAEELTDIVIEQYLFEDLMIFMAEALDMVFTPEDSAMKPYPRPINRQEKAKLMLTKKQRGSTSSSSQKAKKQEPAK